ncbi:MAG: HEPN domain-containing protein [Thiobacillaceae bacterium]|nr:HEPN domain-containing protein [Thiobacillaceae bacterium]MDW8323099.1 HEPN domain-containing protein [Burkholderiales bacterium]
MRSNAEKYLKALVVTQGGKLQRIHNLAALVHQIGQGAADMPCTVDELAELNPCAVVLRYDDQEFELLSRQEIVSRAERMRAWARDRLGLGVQGEAG